MATIFSAEDGLILISGTYIGGGSSFTCQVTEFSVEGGGRDIELAKAFGSGCNGHVFTKKQELYEINLTTISKDIYLSQAIMGGSPAVSTWPTTLSGGLTRYPVSMLFKFEERKPNGTGMAAKVVDAYCTEDPLTVSVDGYLEETFKFKCAPTNFFKQWTGDTTKSGLTLTL